MPEKATSTSQFNVILDIDGVMLDYTSGLFSWLAEHRNMFPSIMPHQVEHFGLHHYFDGGFSRQVYTDFSQHEDFKNIPAYPGAQNFLRKLVKAGFDIHAVTSCGDSVSEALRRDNLKSELEWSHPLHVLPLGGCKAETLSQFDASRSVFVDDLYKNIEAATEVGLETLWYKPYETMLYRDNLEHERAEKPVVGYDMLLKNIQKKALDMGFSCRPEVPDYQPG